MTDKTEIKPDDVKAIAERIRDLLGDMSAFSELQGHQPSAGQFPTAKWLESIVVDRRDGLVRHAHRYKATLNDVYEFLNKVVVNLQGQDHVNADALRKAISDSGGLDDLSKHVDKDVTIT